MLTLPDSGFQPSTTKHNVRIDILTDWVEASVAFIDDELSKNDVVDALCENGIYVEQDFAMIRVGDAWRELERREKSLGDGTPFAVSGRRVRRTAEWDKCTTYSFCLLLTVQVMQRRWARQFGSDYTEQGSLFEEVTVECLSEMGWDVFRTGWAPGNAAKIQSVVRDISTHLGEAEITGAVTKWLSENANEEQLDVVCLDPFVDGWGGRPLFFFQCASGANWPDKLQTPDPDTWHRVISFTTKPQRGFSMPFALLEDDFRRRAGKVNGMLMDRFRLQAPGHQSTPNWCSKQLATKLIKWMRPRIKKLPDDRS